MLNIKIITKSSQTKILKQVIEIEKLYKNIEIEHR